MSENLNLLMPHIRHFCEAGYIMKAERDALYNMADLYDVAKGEVDAQVDEELQKVKAKMMNDVYRYSGQPDASLKNDIDLYPESKRAFPEALNVGTLQLALNPSIRIPACISVIGKAGLTFRGSDIQDSFRFMENIVTRLLLSIPRGVAKVTILDPENMGMSFLDLSGLDRDGILDVIAEEKDVFPFFQKSVTAISSFMFDKLGNKYEDVAAYNKMNRAEARPYNIVLCAPFSVKQEEEYLSLLRKLLGWAPKAGYFFLFAADTHSFNGKTGELLEDFTCVIDASSEKPVIKSVTEDYSLYNNACSFTPFTDLKFDNLTIGKINRELNPEKYPEVKADAADNLSGVKTLPLVWDRKTNLRTDLPSVGSAHLLFVTDDSRKTRCLWQNMLSTLEEETSWEDVCVYMYNGGFRPDCDSRRYVRCVESEKPVYLSGLLERVKQIQEERRARFSQAVVLDYSEYREKTKEAIPRILVLVEGMESILDSVDMNADKSIGLLEEMLPNAGKFGIHFILGSRFTHNCLRLSPDAFRVGMFSGLSADQMTELGAPFFGNATLSAKDDFMLVVSDKAEENVTVYGLKYDDAQKVRPRVPAGPFEGPYTLIEKTDGSYPADYATYRPENVVANLYEGRCVVGIPRRFSESFYSLPLGGEHVFVAGRDEEAFRSLLHSVDMAVSLASLSLQVMDSSSRGAVGIPGLRSVPLADLASVKMENRGVVCVLGAEAFSSEQLQKLSAFMEEARKYSMTVFVFAEGSSLEEDWNDLLPLFDCRLALSDAPEDVISSIHFIVDESLEKPAGPLQCLAEGPQGVDMLWLFKY